MTHSRFEQALKALDTATTRDEKDDLVGRQLAEAIRQSHPMTTDAASEILHLAARYHYPISPGRDKKSQLAALIACGYTKHEARRFSHMVQSGGHLLADGTCDIFLSGTIYGPGDPDWAYSITRLWPSLSDGMRKKAIARDPAFADIPLPHQANPFQPVKSAVLGSAVPDSWGCGFPDVLIPVIDQTVVICLDLEPGFPLAKLDDCLRCWLAPNPQTTAAIAEGLIRYKDLIADAGGEDLDHITTATVWDHIALTTGLVRCSEGTLSIAFGEGCDWEEEHGVQVVLDAEGKLVSVGEVG